MARIRIVAIGASAGGVNALRLLAERLPADFPAPLLVVQHIGSLPSMLPDILTDSGPLRAHHANEGETLLPGHIVVAPSDHHMLVLQGRVRLSRGPKEHHSRPAIDPTFLSLALDAGPAAVGVILTGTLDDGTTGLRAIKGCGGTAIVQDPADAEYPSMPASAQRYVAVDRSATIDQMAGVLVEEALRPVPEPPQVRHPWAREFASMFSEGRSMENLQAIASPSSLACPECHGALWQIEDADPPRYRCHTGHGYTARTLLHAYAEASDAALWNAVRALQEESILLRRMAQVAQPRDPARLKLESAATSLQMRADELRRFAQGAREVSDERPAAE